MFPQIIKSTFSELMNIRSIFNPQPFLVGGFNPFEKYARQIGSFPPGKVENKKYLETTTYQ